MNKQEQLHRLRPGSTILQNSKLDVRGIFAIILACITVVALVAVIMAVVITRKTWELHREQRLSSA